MAYELAKIELSGARAGFCAGGLSHLLSKTTTTPTTKKTATTV